MLLDVHCFNDSPLDEKKKAVDRCRDKYSYTSLCNFLKLSRRTYIYHWNNKEKENEHEIYKKNMMIEIEKVWREYDGIPGYKMTYRILRSKGIKVSYQLVSSIMKELKLEPPRKNNVTKPRTKDPCDKTKTDLLKQNFNAVAPNRVWISDCTELKVNNLRVFLFIILDIFSKKIVGESIGLINDTNLILRAFKKAYDSRNHPRDLIFHSDRGSNYTSKEFTSFLENIGVRQSFSRPHCPYDNSCMESFFSNYKREYYKSKKFSRLEELEDSIKYYISFYNNDRINNKFTTPNKLEEEYYKTIK